VHGLEVTEPVPGRLNAVTCGQPFAVYVDYAHTPDAIVRLCETVREINDGRVLLMFGCGGDRDRGKRPMMGRAAIENASYVVVTSDNPRSEDPSAIIEDIKTGLSGYNFEVVLDRREAIAAIMKKAGPGDAVVLAGKGAEPYQEIKGERHPFSDSEEARAALGKMGFTQAGAAEPR
jgi:UDP-N-acetylmuramoyl-L-alanyl-D-glutamate--2,6-diaminopimelate ligase